MRRKHLAPHKSIATESGAMIAENGHCSPMRRDLLYRWAPTRTSAINGFANS